MMACVELGRGKMGRGEGEWCQGEEAGGHIERHPTCREKFGVDSFCSVSGSCCYDERFLCLT